MKFLRKNYLRVSCFLIALFILSCQKTEVDSVDSASTLTVAKAKSWFEATYINNSLSGSRSSGGKENLRKLLEKNPEWLDAYAMRVSIGESIVIPLKWEADWMPRYTEAASSSALIKGDRKLGLDHLTYLQVYRDSKGKLTSELVTAIPDAQWSANPTKAFSGVILVEGWNSEFQRGYKYQNGQVVGEVSTETPKNSNGRACVAYACGELVHYQTAEVTLDSGERLSFVSEQYRETIYCTNCTGGDGNSTGSTSNDYGNGQAVPSATNLLQPIQNLTGSIVRTVLSKYSNIITNKLTKKCHSDILNELICGSYCDASNTSADAISTIVALFTNNGFTGDIGALNITVVTENGSALGGSDADFVKENDYNGTITLNGPLLSSASREYISVTLMHEFIHAYFSMVRIGRPEDLKVGETRLDQHTMMVNYIEPMTRALVERFHISESDALALAWGGLHETNAWRSLPPVYQNTVIQVNKEYRNGTRGLKCN